MTHTAFLAFAVRFAQMDVKGMSARELARLEGELRRAIDWDEGLSSSGWRWMAASATTPQGFASMAHYEVELLRETVYGLLAAAAFHEQEWRETPERERLKLLPGRTYGFRDERVRWMVRRDARGVSRLVRVGDPLDSFTSRIIRALEDVGIDRIRRCPAEECGHRLFLKVTKKRYCSTRCQTRLCTRAHRAAERRERERFMKRGDHGKPTRKR